MKFAVYVAARAHREILAAHAYIALDSPEMADRWLAGIYSAIATLAEFPQRCPRAREADDVRDSDMRQLVYTSYRVIFRVRAERVEVSMVRHGRMRSATPDELAR
jgi:plasmid stabilization system protein ParE